jgi:F-type H+-transporting ATPase subunit alpha
VELLKQPQYQPLPVEQQVVSIWAVANGFTDELPVPDVRRFESELNEFLRDRHGELYDHIREQGTLPEDQEEKLRSAIDEFKNQFSPTQAADAPKEKEADELEGEEEEERLKRKRRKPPEKKE